MSTDLRAHAALGRAAAIVIGSVSLVSASRFLLDAWLVDHLPYLLFFAAVAVSTRLAGWPAGLFAIAASLLSGSLLFVQPPLLRSLTDGDVLIELTVFVVVSLSVVGLIESQSRTQRELQLANERLQREHAERRNLERELETSRRLESLGQLAGGIAHDFNNLLTVVQGAAELLSARRKEDPLLAAISGAAERGADLTKQLLRFARREQMLLRPISLNDSVLECQALVARLLPEDLSFSVTLHPDPWRFLGDASQVLQVLLNLLTNARDAMKDGGVISIRTDNVTIDESSATLHPERHEDVMYA